MKAILFGLIAALFLFPTAARADHHEVFVHSAIKLDSRSCAVELEIFANSQNGFEGVDRIAVNGATLASLGDSVAGVINAGGHTNAGDRILFASSNFQLETGLAPDVIFDDGKCGIFVPNSVFTFVIDDISFGGANTIIDTLTADASFGVNLTAMTKASNVAAAQFVDLNAATLTVENNGGASAVVGGGGGGGCGISPVEGDSPNQARLFYPLSLLLFLSVRLRRRPKQAQASK